MRRRCIRREQQINLVVGDQFLVDRRFFREVGLIIIDDEINRPFGSGDIETAGCVGSLDPQLIGFQSGNGGWREWSGLCYGNANLDRIRGACRVPPCNGLFAILRGPIWWKFKPKAFREFAR